MRITVECGIKSKHEIIKETLVSSSKYTYIGADPKSMQASMMFEADSSLNKDEAIKVAKSLIKGNKDCAMALFRVILSDDRFYFPR